MCVVETEYLRFARFYNTRWGLSVGFASASGAYLHEWRIYSERPMEFHEIASIYYRCCLDKKKLRIFVLTGPYMRLLEKPMFVIDVDDPMVRTEDAKNSLMRSFAKNGYVVVSTRRGFHLHGFLSKSENLPHVITLITRDEEERARTVGEGGCLMPHTWTSPPSSRVEDGVWFTYSFVLPDGTRFASYDTNKIARLEPTTFSLEEIKSDVSLLLGAEVRSYTPMEGEPVKIENGAGETPKRTPVFRNLDELIAYVGSEFFPKCVSWVIYHYLRNTPEISYIADHLLAQYGEEIEALVPEGKRFLVAANTALFLAHTVDEITFNEIIDILQHAFENWPHDKDGRLDRKLKYLFYADNEGHVYPRYGGSGTLSPLPVLTEEYCQTCPFWAACKGKNPWRGFIKTHTHLFHQFYINSIQ